MEGWVKEVEDLAKIAKTQPHVAFTLYTHCTKYKWSFLLRTVPEVANLFQPIEDAITNHLLPALTGHDKLNSMERELMALPARLGGLGIPDPTLQDPTALQNSRTISSTLTALITNQSQDLSEENQRNQFKAKQELKRKQRDTEKKNQQMLLKKLPANLKRAVKMSSEKGASSWLTAIPIEKHGFLLHKGEFYDTIQLRYGWIPGRLPRNCVCGKPFTVDHAMICSHGGFPTLQNNELPDVTAKLMTETCHNVGTEPTLQPCLEKSYSRRVQTEKMVLDWILWRTTSG